jgi:hypothetical protein
MRDSASRSRVLACAALAALVLAAFWPCVDARFVNWDDHVNLADLRERGSVWSFFVAPGRVDPYQPLAWLSLGFDRWLWGLDAGLDAPQAGRFHATSVVIHALAACAFLGVARRVLRVVLPGASARSIDIAAALAACVFAVHPLRVESVAWVTERRDVVSGLLYLLAAGAWLATQPSASDRIVRRAPAVGAAVAAALAAVLGLTSLDFDGRTLDPAGLGVPGLVAALAAVGASTVLAARALAMDAPRALRLALCVVALLLALTAKGLSVVLPALMLAFDLWPLRRLRGPSLGASLVEKAPLFALAAISARVSIWAQVANGRTFSSYEAHGLAERVLQACYGLWFYPSRTFAPVATSPSNFLPDELSIGEPRFAVAVVFTLSAALTAIFVRRRWPGFTLACATFALGAAPILGLTQAGAQLVADRYSYIAAMPFSMLVAGAWAQWVCGRARIVVLASAAIAVLALTWATHVRARAWHDSESLWRYAVAVDPRDGFAHAQLGSALAMRAPALEVADEVQRMRLEADRMFRRAIELDPTPLPGSLLHHGINLLALDRAAEAVPVLQGHVHDFPDDSLALTYLGSSFGALRRFGEALPLLERAVLDPGAPPRAWQALGRVREELGDAPGAIAAYEHVLARWPGQAGVRQRLDALKAASGEE